MSADQHQAGSGPGSSGGHNHSHASIRSGERHKGRLAAAFGLLAVFMVVEFVAGLWSNSLALLSDAGHMLTDVLGLGMALAAIQVASRGTDRRHRTFGLYRLEILAALANAVLLCAVAIYVLVEAIGRFDNAPEVLGIPMLVVASLGLAANLVAFLLLRAGSKESLNVEGAYLEVLSDTIGSVGVIIAAIVLQVTGWTWVDPVVGVGIGLWILPRTWRLGAHAVRILVQAAPPGVDLDSMQTDLSAVSGVVDVHDLHVWTLTSDMEVASAHLMVRSSADSHRVLDEAREVLQDRYGIGHATLQVEPEDHEGCDEVAW
ncbi:MAG: cation diffusion facilitator family transporter [Acidimicrobiales bacterium]